MALDHNLKMMELQDAKLAQVLTDKTGDANPTYSATWADLMGITKITVAPKTETKKLYGDSELKDVYTKTTEVELDVEASFMSLDALKAVMGGTLVDSGVTPNQKTVFSLKSSNSTPPYFKIEGKWNYTGVADGADAHVILYKCKVTDPPTFELNDASGSFGTMKFKAVAFPCASNGTWFDVIVNETAAVISATP